MADSSILASISCFSWNKEGKEVALSPGNRDVYIYSYNAGNKNKPFQKLCSLEGHQMRVTGIDWNKGTNKIATSSQDRNAYVWTKQKQNEWKPTLVVLRIGRAATCIKWSPNGKKFAVGSGSKQIPVCNYEESQDMWVAKMIKKAGKSSILSIDWSPDGLFIIAGGSDFKCRIFSAYIKKVDADCKVDDYGGAIDAQGASSFGTALCEFDTSKGWIESCRFSPNGMRFAFSGHDSSVHFGAFDGGKTTVQTITRKGLPMNTIAFLTDTLVVAGGYDFVPVLYEYNGSQWQEKGPLDSGTGAAKQKAKTSSNKIKNNIFTQNDKRGGAKKDDDIKTRHENVINGIEVTSPTTFCASSIDGRLLFWDTKKKY